MSESTAVADQSSRPRARALARRRRENAPGGRRHRHSVLVTPEEEGVLVRLAAEQGVTVPRLLVEAATAERVGMGFEDFQAAAATQIPVQRVGRPEDIADAIAYFSNERAGFVSGQVLYVAGGPLD